MLVGAEYNKNHEALLVSYYDEEGNLDYIKKKITSKDLFEWVPHTAGDGPPEGRNWDKRYVSKKRTHYLNRYRIEEIMHERFTQDDWDKISSVAPPKVFYVDIEVEVDKSNKFPDPEIAPCPINALTLVEGDNIYVLTTKYLDDQERIQLEVEVNEYFLPFNRKFKLYYTYFKTEKDLLTAFVQYFMPKIGFLTGWNVINFDWQTIYNRTVKHNKIDITKYLLSHETFGRENIPIHMGIIDYIDALKKFKPLDDMENHSLDYTSNRVLGIKKLTHSESFYELQQKHFKFLKYNIIDTILPQLIDEDLEQLKASFAISAIARTEISRIFGPVFMTELMIIKRLLDRNLHTTKENKFQTDDKSKYKGAYVKEPIPGFYRNIVCFDFSSMYPNIQIQFNISMDSLLGQADQINLNELMPGSYTITKNNTVFTLEFDSVTKELLVYLYGLRVEVQNEIKDLEEELRELEK